MDGGKSRTQSVEYLRPLLPDGAGHGEMLMRGFAATEPLTSALPWSIFVLDKRRYPARNGVVGVAAKSGDYKCTVYPAQDDEDRPVVAMVWEGEQPYVPLEEAIARQGLDHRAHWFVLRFDDDLLNVKWFSVEFNYANGRLDRLYPLHGVPGEVEAVESVRRHKREVTAALDAKWLMAENE